MINPAVHEEHIRNIEHVHTVHEHAGKTAVNEGQAGEIMNFENEISIRLLDKVVNQS